MRSPVSFTYRQPIDWAKVATYVFTISAILITFYRHWATLSPLVTGSHIWSLLALGFILTMTSGYMWNQIRHPPYMVGGQNGKPVTLVASGYSNQYGVETHIISGVCQSILLELELVLTAASRWRPHIGNDGHSRSITKSEITSSAKNRRLSLGWRAHRNACGVDGLVQNQVAWVSFWAVHVE